MASWSERGRWLLPSVLLAFFVHAGILKQWFVASDTLALIETSRVSNAGDLAAIFTRPLMYGSDFVDSALFYRPVASLSYAVDYAIWGLTPFGYHLTNLVLHAIAVALAGIAVVVLTDRRKAGFLTAVLFALHPITVEVVPVTARRQDILLMIFTLVSVIWFVRWYRRFDDAPGANRQWKSFLLRGALVAYLLALGSKETAIVVPVLLAVWVLLRCDVDHPRRTLRTLLVTIGPFAVITACYLTLRVAVLGGLGGYSVESTPSPLPAVVDVPLFAVKYVLWLAYPSNYLGKVMEALPMGTLMWGILVPVAILVGGAALLGLVRRDPFQRRRLQRLWMLSSLGSVLGFTGLGLVLMRASWLESLDPAVLIGYATGVLFVGGCVGCVLTTAFVEESPFAGTTWRHVVFFGCWIFAPLCVLAASGFVTSRPLEFGFGIRNAYFALPPSMAICSLLVLPSLERTGRKLRGVLPGERRLSEDFVDSDVVRTVAIALLVVPLVVTSPLVYSDSGWHAAGELNEQTLRELDAALDDTTDERFVFLVNFPNEFDAQQRPYPHAQSVTPLRPYSIEAWLELQRHANHEVRFVRKRTVTELPAELSFRTEQRDGWTVVRTTMNGNATAGGR